MKNVQDMFDLTGKTAFITGGGGLLGKKHAEAIVEAGGNAIVADFSTVSAVATAGFLNEKYGRECVFPCFIDVTRKDLVEKAVAKYDKIDILINNAARDPKVSARDGLTPDTRFETMSPEYWYLGVDAIINGTFFCSQVVANKMLETGGGVILNIASDLGVIAPDQRIYRKEGVEDSMQNVKPITYSAAKWAVIGMTKYLATYFADKGIRVNALSPSGVYNDHPEEFVQKLSSLIPMGRMANIDEYKGAVLFLCSNASSYMTGANLIIDGGKSVW
jgi:NAD(P)-dependent dehydrogenase (short-subunit alcohol dehydrogenase family)